MNARTRKMMTAAVLLCGPSLLPGAERVVTLGASVTETAFALGAGERVVARDDSSLVPPAARERPSVGYYRTIGAEGVLSMAPDLILAATGTGPEEQVEILRRSGLPLVEIADQPSVETLLGMVSRVGTALSREEAAADLTARLEAELSAVREVVEGMPRRPRMAVLMGQGGGFMAAYEDTAADALIHLVGAENAFGGQRGYKPTSMEAIVAAAPDFILLTTRGADGDLAVLEGERLGPGLRVTAAAQAGRVWALEMADYLVFGPRLPAHALRLAQRIEAELRDEGR